MLEDDFGVPDSTNSTTPIAGGTLTSVLKKTEVSGDSYAEAYRSSGSTATGKGFESSGPGSATKPGHGRVAVGTKPIGVTLRFCEEAVARALSSSDDIAVMVNAINDLCDGLRTLWEYRESRERQFGRLVNHLHLLLVGVEPETITTGHLEAVQGVLREVAVQPVLTDPHLRDLERGLVRAGFNVFRGLE